MTAKKPNLLLQLKFENVGAIAAIISSIAAVIVGAAALYIAWDQARVMRAQQHAAVWPILSIDLETEIDGSQLTVQFLAENAGIGPALLRHAELRNAQGVIHSWAAFRDALPDDIAKSDQVSHASVPGRALFPGRKTTPYSLTWDLDENPDLTIKKMEPWLENTSLEICYCSVFDRCWVQSSDNQAAAQPVPACANGADGIQ